MGFQNLGSGGSSSVDLTLYTPPDTVYASTVTWEQIKSDLSSYRTIYLTTDNRNSDYSLNNVVFNSNHILKGFRDPFSYTLESSRVSDASIIINRSLVVDSLRFSDLTCITRNSYAWVQFTDCIFENLVISENVQVLSISHCRVVGTITNNSVVNLNLDYVLINDLANLPDPSTIQPQSIVVVEPTRTAYMLSDGVWESLGVNNLNNSQNFNTVSPFRLAISLLANRDIDGGTLP